MQLFYPLDKIHITQHFGERPQFYRPLNGHNGIDFRTKFEDSPEGVRPVMASADGEVKEVGDQGKKGYGRYIRLLHEDGSETVYGHLTRPVVIIHQKVTAKQLIGFSGNTGLSSGAHLHFSYRPGNWNYSNGYAGYVNPLNLFVPDKFPHPYFEQVEDDPAVYVYDHELDKFIPIGDGKVFQLMRGGYEGIKKVKQLSREVVQNQILNLINL